MVKKQQTLPYKNPFCFCEDDEDWEEENDSQFVELETALFKNDYQQVISESQYGNR